MSELTQKFRAQWKVFGIKSTDKVLVAVSTGADSMALLTLLEELPKNIRPKINVAYVDHQLRAQSKAETKFIKEYCDKKQLPLFVKVWDDLDQKAQTGIEEKARQMRYEFFSEVLKKQQIKYLLTAHHADDQAETFLMKLLRGGDLTQLVGIKKKRSFGENAFLLRPLLNFSKEELAQFIQTKQLPYFEDETNESDAYLRNCLRHGVVKELKKQNLKFLDHIKAYSEQLDDVLALASELSKEKLASLKVDQGYDLAKWQAFDDALKRQTLRVLFKETKLDLNEAQLTQAKKLLDNAKKPQGKLDIGKNYVLEKSYTSFQIKKVQKTTHADQAQVVKKLELGKWCKISATKKIGLFSLEEVALKKDDDILYVNKDKAPFYLRHRSVGDRLLSKAGSQKVKKILIDKKIASEKRDALWLLSTSEKEVFWIIGVKKTDLSPRAVNAKMHYIIVLRKEVNY